MCTEMEMTSQKWFSFVANAAVAMRYIVLTHQPH